MKKHLKAIVVFAVVVLFFGTSCTFASDNSISSTETLTVSKLAFDRVLNYATSVLNSSSDDVIVNLNDSLNENDSLILSEVGFNTVNQGEVLDIEDVVIDEQADTVPAVVGDALVYPNPFRQNSDTGGILGYELSKDMDIEIHVYNMLAQKIAHMTFDSGAAGGKIGYNKIRFYNETWGGHVLSAGVYFFLIINDGNVLSRGKMAVKP